MIYRHIKRSYILLTIKSNVKVKRRQKIYDEKITKLRTTNKMACAASLGLMLHSASRREAGSVHYFYIAMIRYSKGKFELVSIIRVF